MATITSLKALFESKVAPVPTWTGTVPKTKEVESNAAPQLPSATSNSTTIGAATTATKHRRGSLVSQKLKLFEQIRTTSTATASQAPRSRRASMGPCSAPSLHQQGAPNNESSVAPRMRAARRFSTTTTSREDVTTTTTSPNPAGELVQSDPKKASQSPKLSASSSPHHKSITTERQTLGKSTKSKVKSIKEALEMKNQHNDQSHKPMDSAPRHVARRSKSSDENIFALPAGASSKVRRTKNVNNVEHEMMMTNARKPRRKRRSPKEDSGVEESGGTAAVVGKITPRGENNETLTQHEPTVNEGRGTKVNSLQGTFNEKPTTDKMALLSQAPRMRHSHSLEELLTDSGKDSIPVQPRRQRSASTTTMSTMDVTTEKKRESHHSKKLHDPSTDSHSKCTKSSKKRSKAKTPSDTDQVGKTHKKGKGKSTKKRESKSSKKKRRSGQKRARNSLKEADAPFDWGKYSHRPTIGPRSASFTAIRASSTQSQLTPQRRKARRASTGRLRLDDTSRWWLLNNTHAVQMNPDIQKLSSGPSTGDDGKSNHPQTDPSPPDYGYGDDVAGPSKAFTRPAPERRMVRRHSTGSVSAATNESEEMVDFWHTYDEESETSTADSTDISTDETPTVPIKTKYSRRRAVRFDQNVTVFMFTKEEPYAFDDELKLPQSFVPSKAFSADSAPKAPVRRSNDVERRVNDSAPKAPRRSVAESDEEDDKEAEEEEDDREAEELASLGTWYPEEIPIRRRVRFAEENNEVHIVDRWIEKSVVFKPVGIVFCTSENDETDNAPQVPRRRCEEALERIHNHLRQLVWKEDKERENREYDLKPFCPRRRGSSSTIDCVDEYFNELEIAFSRPSSRQELSASPTAPSFPMRRDSISTHGGSSVDNDESESTFDIPSERKETYVPPAILYCPVRRGSISSTDGSSSHDDDPCAMIPKTKQGVRNGEKASTSEGPQFIWHSKVEFTMNPVMPKKAPMNLQREISNPRNRASNATPEGDASLRPGTLRGDSRRSLYRESSTRSMTTDDVDAFCATNSLRPGTLARDDSTRSMTTDDIDHTFTSLNAYLRPGAVNVKSSKRPGARRWDVDNSKSSHFDDKTDQNGGVVPKGAFTPSRLSSQRILAADEPHGIFKNCGRPCHPGR